MSNAWLYLELWNEQFYPGESLEPVTEQWELYRSRESPYMEGDPLATPVDCFAWCDATDLN